MSVDGQEGPQDLKETTTTGAVKRSRNAYGRPKFAVVGASAAGVGALTALLDSHEDADIVVFDIGKPIREPPSPPPDSDEAVNEFYNGVYKEIRATLPFKFPPVKTHFGERLPQDPVGNRPVIFRSDSLGGLTNYWGGTMLPFTDRELARWPIDARTLAPYFRRIAEVVGVSGRHDGLNRYFTDEFSNRPALRPVPMLGRLDEQINGSTSHGDYTVVSGVNRCALETRKEHHRNCVSCGECMSGCFRGSVYSAKHTLDEYVQDPRISAVVRGKVAAVDPATRSVRVRRQGNDEVISGFDRIFLCAGCPGSTEIVMRSAGLHETCPMVDNAVYVFPILYWGRLRRSDRETPYVSLSNLIFGCIPRSQESKFAQAQIYPNFDYLWRYNVPPRLWPIVRPLIRYSRARVFWVRMYLDGHHSSAYSARLEDDRIVYDVAQAADGESISALMKSIRSSVNHNGFWIPPIAPLLQKTSAHYAATLPYQAGRIDVSRDGEVLPGIHICDSACFPDLPAVSVTYTIMANAYRTACEATGSGAPPRLGAVARQ